MPNLGAPELIIILIIVVLIFGGSKLPKLARSLGEAKNEFEKSSSTEAKTLAAKDGAAKADGDEKVTMTKAELDALLAERELKAKRD
jgi:sec-independent protein translocase protein TatA